MITKRTGNGQTVCKGCNDKGNFGLTWDSWLYNFNNEPYCFECLMEKLENYQNRINKAITNIDILQEIIYQQPTDNQADDLWLLDKLDGIKNVLKGE